MCICSVISRLPSENRDLSKHTNDRIYSFFGDARLHAYPSVFIYIYIGWLGNPIRFHNFRNGIIRSSSFGGLFVNKTYTRTPKFDTDPMRDLSAIYSCHGVIGNNFAIAQNQYTSYIYTSILPVLSTHVEPERGLSKSRSNSLLITYYIYDEYILYSSYIRPTITFPIAVFRPKKNMIRLKTTLKKRNLIHLRNNIFSPKNSLICIHQTNIYTYNKLQKRTKTRRVLMSDLRKRTFTRKGLSGKDVG